MAKNNRCLLGAVCFLAVLCLALLVVVIVIAGNAKGFPPNCQENELVQRDFKNPGVFNDLTPDEMQNIQKYLEKQKSLHVQTDAKDTVNRTYIFNMDLHLPEKKVVLKFLKNGKIPLQRTSKVSLFRGDVNPPRVEEYIVGPLPMPNYYKLFQDSIHAEKIIPFYSRPFDYFEDKLINKMLKQVGEKLYPVLKESFGAGFHNCSEPVHCIMFFPFEPKGQRSGERKTWYASFRQVEGFYLFPLGLEIEVEHLSVNKNDWRVIKLVYNGQMFSSASELLHKYQQNSINKVRLQTVKRHDNYASYSQKGRKVPKHPTPGPRLYQPGGQRFTVENQHIHYMEWDFNYRQKVSTGLMIQDVRFQGERIAYEISNQETLVFYSGYGPIQINGNYYDSSYMMGALSFELVRGVDCPDTAVYLDAHFFAYGEQIYIKNSVCIFENNPGIPLRRHYTYSSEIGGTHYGGLVDYHLVVRSIMSVWNYDYVFDYIFHLNGVVEVKVSPTGYVQSTFDLPQERNYGNPIYHNVVANIHQHLFHYKVDLDIGGQSNRFATYDISTETVLHPWFKNMNKTQLRFNRHIKQAELDAAVQFNFSEPKYYVFYNEKKTNKYGTHRAYRIQHRGMSKLLLPTEGPYASAPWAKYQIAVTQFKDEEHSSSSMYAQNDPYKPFVDFQKFLDDNETLVDKDLVVWLSLGMHHIPYTEDVPSTTTTGSQLAFLIRPYNYFTQCPSITSTDAVHVLATKNHGVHIDTFGTSLEDKSCSPKYSGPFAYNGNALYTT